MAKKTLPTNKMAAVRLAVRELGGDASAADVKKWVKDKHSLDLTDATVQNYVSTARREIREQNGTSAKTLPKKTVAQSSAPVSKAGSPATISTQAAVREAVKALGVEAPIATVRMWVKDTYNLEMTDATAQKYFYDSRKELREQNGTLAKTPPKKAVVQPPTQPPPVSKGASPGVDEIIEAITVLKELAGKIGKDNLVKLLETV